MTLSNAPATALDPDHRAMLERLAAAAAAVPADALTPQRRRALAREACALLDPSPPDGCATREDLGVPLQGRTLPARLYRPLPDAAASAAEDVLLVYFHGGGWVLGGVDTHDDACAWLSARLGCTLLSVEYRKAPEHPFPAPCDDAADAYAWAWSQRAAWGCSRIAIGGDSSGGHLAAHAMFSHAEDVPTAAALLFYPVADTDFTNVSHREKSAGPGLTTTAMQWFWVQLMGSLEPVDDVRAVPMRQRWARTPPPTVISLAMHDPLHDEGLAYAALLQRAGATVRVHDAADMAHGFLRHHRISAAAHRHLEGVADSLADLLRP